MSKAYNSAKIKEIASIFKSVIGKEQAVYVSVPITTGQRFLNWYEKVGEKLSKSDYGELHFKDVIQPNMDDAQDFINHIRHSHECIVIEPTSFNITGWTQENYHIFWEAVINEYVSKIYFLDGWYLSKGCSLEFLTGIKKGIEVCNQNKQSFNINEGVALIKKGIKDYEHLGLDSKFQTKILNELNSLI